MNPLVVKLSCDECRQRKTKCDKGSPCSACKHAGTNCTTVQRARHPRGRSGNTKKKTVLESRVAQLEDLVKQLGTQIERNNDNNGMDTSKSDSDQTIPLPTPIKANAMLAKDFFAKLSYEVAGIREVLDDSIEENGSHMSSESSSKSGPSPGTSPTSILFGYQPHISDNEIVAPVADNVREVLLNIYHDRVDCLFKATYWPAAETAIIQRYYEELKRGTPCSIHPVERAIYFMAVCAMTESECEAMLSESRSNLIYRNKRAVEIALARSDFLTNPDKLALQAFVLYLMGLRVCQQYALSWTLLALAIRAGNALGLPLTEPCDPVSVGDDLKLRLWYCIGMLDSQTSIDRGTRPMMTLKEFQRKPLLVNHDAGKYAPPSRRQNLTHDMSFSHVIHEATICSRRLMEFPPDTAGTWETWDKKLQIISDFEIYIRQYCSNLDCPSHDLQRFVQFTAEDIVLNMQLFLRRPMFPSKTSPFPPWDKFDVLKVTTEIMERTLWKATDSAFAPWAWLSKTWLKWQVLAVLLAELCTPRYGELGDRAYAIAKEGFDYCSALMAETDLATVLKPLAKLMSRVTEVRTRMMNEQRILGGVSSVSSTTGTNTLSQSNSADENSFSLFPTGVSDLTSLTYINNANGADAFLNTDQFTQAPSYMNGDMSADASWLNWNVFLGEMGDPWTVDPYPEYYNGMNSSTL
ncbi:histone deacetylase [Talaromyces pinophilus]|uniref:Histone deacetylase n=1 Tax=Talaromyces pinophilus TaxID=128442 RepID=A0A6V8H396_TALPI|nr:histone deacetylase [Talaromyces pinophilus]